jgi:hypothetical protein
MEQQTENNIKPDFQTLFIMVGEIKGTLAEVKDQLKTVTIGHDKRINCLESDTANMKGQAGVIGGVVSLIVSVISIAIAYFKGN